MKKSKEVRKAEIKAAVIRQLKSLIVPIIILLIIVAAVLVVTLWKEEEEPVEIVRVNAFEGQEKEFVLENDKLLFTMDTKTTQFSILVKENGKVWYSNPQDVDADSVAMGQEKNKLRSTLFLTYSNMNGVDTLFNNYAYSMEKGIYDIEAGEDYIKIYYSIGDVEKEFVIPPVILETELDAFLEKMTTNDRQLVKDYYKKYDINKLGAKDDKDELLANYPILETEVIYVLRDTTKDNIKGKFEQLFEAAGYTYEDYLADKEMDLAEKISSKPVFNINVIYRLDGDDLVVEVPMGEMEHKEEYPIYSVSILPYFGAAGKSEEGFLFVPEGGGALINFNNGKIAQSSYYANVYGWDMAQGRSAIVHETRTYFNVFGISNAEDAFICIMEKGAPYASIQADISGRLNSYNFVNAVYTVQHREQYDIADRFTGSMYVYEEDVPQESLVQRYRFVSSGNYVDMANTYRDYLLTQYAGYLTPNGDGSVPVSVEILGAVDKTRQVLGVPVSRPLKLTTYKEAKQIMEELKGDGIENLSVKLSGWMNGGVQQKILKKVKLVSDLGSTKDFKALTDYASANGIPLYLNGITNYAHNSNLLDRFVEFSDVAKYVSKEKVELYPYSTITFGKMEYEDAYYLLKADLVVKMAENLAKYAESRNAGVSLEDIGKDLSSDFREGEVVRRQVALDSQREWLKAQRDNGMAIMINEGNDYAMPFSDMITNMDLTGSEYTIIDQAVPFYQIAIHGYVNYTGRPLNLAQNWEEELLESAEYGAGLSFTVMNETAFALQKTLYTKYFGADYASWHDRMLEVYRRYNAELGGIFNQKMAGHERITDSLTCTVYEDGTKVYVNYGYSDVTADDGTVVGARDYKAVK